MRKSDATRVGGRPDIRFDKDRAVRIDHHSAKGKVVRNVGSFTRGTQLVRLEYMMVWQGVKVPLLVGLGTFIVLLFLSMFLFLHEHETQLVLMRIYAAFWSWCDLSPDKTVNLTLADGQALDVIMACVGRRTVRLIATSRLG